MKRIQNILVSVDTRFDEHPALRWAIRLAETSQAKLKIVDVAPVYSWIAKLAIPDAAHTQQVLVDEKIRGLELIADPLRGQGLDVTTKVLSGKTSFEIIYEVMRSQHDLVLRVTKGAHSKQTGFFGTTSLRLLRNCPCAVWLVRPDAPQRIANVLSAIDPAPSDIVLNQMNQSVMDLGKSIADYENGKFHVVNAWDLFGASVVKSRLQEGEFEKIMTRAKKAAATVLDKFLEPYNLNHQSDCVHLLCDEIGVGHAIEDLAKQLAIDLIVVGTIARSGVAAALMGNTAEHVLDHVQCSVLAIKPEGFVSPVTLPDE